MRSPSPKAPSREVAELGTGTRSAAKTDQDAHIACQAKASSGGSHPLELQTPRKHGLPPRARTSPPSGSTCDASLPREAGREPRSPDAASQRTAEATQTPPPLRARPVPAAPSQRGPKTPPQGSSRDWRLTNPAAHSPPHQGSGIGGGVGSGGREAASRGAGGGGCLPGETEARSSREEAWGLDGPGTTAGR